MTAATNSKGVIFDLDGVLVDTGQFHKLSWYDLAKKQGFVMSDEFFYRTFGMQNYQIMPMLAGKELPADEIERLSVWKEQRYRELIAGELKLLDGVERLLDELKTGGFSLAVGTSTPRVNLDFMLERGLIDKVKLGRDGANSAPTSKAPSASRSSGAISTDGGVSRP